jgi:sugar O-acyltransferase (sialic acid O-acetyltransferase NeuD family)
MAMIPGPKAAAKVVLYGVESSYSGDMAESIARAGNELVAGVVTGELRIGLGGIPVIVTPDEITPRLLRHPVAVVRHVPGQRKCKAEEAAGLGFEAFAQIVDPTAIVSQSAELGRGVYVNALAAIGSRAELADFVYIGSQSSIGHHTRLEDYCTVSPGVTIASHCHIGRGVFIGAGVTIAPQVTIGPNSVIGAGATVIKDVAANTVVAGNPARVIREGIKGYMDAEV